jgi:hypothetical protein
MEDPIETRPPQKQRPQSDTPRFIIKYIWPLNSDTQ